MKFKADRATLLKALAHVQSVVEKRNTIPILANVMIAAQGHPADAHRDRHGDRGRRGGAGDQPAGRRLHRPRRDAVRDRPQAARRGRGRARPSRRRRPADAARRPLRHQPGGAADRRFPLDDGRHAAAPLRAVGAGAARPDRPHPLRHQHRGDPLLPQRHLPACHRERGRAGAARRRHRRPSPRPRRGAAAGGRRRHAGRDHPAQDRDRTAQAARRSHRRCRDGAVGHAHPVQGRHHHADQQADRRHLPGIRARHSARQRQDAARRQEGFLRCRWRASRRFRRSGRGR